MRTERALSSIPMSKRIFAVLMTATLALSVAAGSLILASSRNADAFGSVDSGLLSQKPVHEKITRVLACTSNQKPANCFEPLSIDLLAGSKGNFGAVGEPDNPLDGFPNPAARHCDEGDYGDATARTQQDAWAELTKCVALYQQYLDFAVTSAAGLLDASGNIDPAATRITNSFGSVTGACSFPDPAKGNTSSDTAKCAVLNGMGRALHLHEDVWSHSNWGDVADPNVAIGTIVGTVASNPNGLGRTDQPAFFAYPGPIATTFPEGFISGCDDSVTASSCGNRYSHSQVSKDNGTVDPLTCIGTEPMTPRGKVVVDGISNFQRAVTGACGAALRTWTDLGNALAATYGRAAADKMIRAITDDTPTTDCAISGAAALATSGPVGVETSARSTTITLVNQSSASFACGDAILDSGEWANLPPDGLAAGSSAQWRTQSAGAMTGTDGSVTLTSGTSKVTIVWSNPFFGSNTSSCTTDTGLTCTVVDGSGNDASITVTISNS